MVVLLFTRASVGPPPNVTLAPKSKPEPKRVTIVPPVTAPPDGETVVTVMPPGPGGVEGAAGGVEGADGDCLLQLVVIPAAIRTPAIAASRTKLASMFTPSV
jgi:hypothetical protein